MAGSKPRRAAKVPASGRNPAQKPTRVSRAGAAGKPRSLGPGPVSGAAAMARDRVPSADRSPALNPPMTKPGTAPVPDRGRRSAPTSVSGTPNIRDQRTPGTTIAQRANATGKRRKAAG